MAWELAAKNALEKFAVEYAQAVAAAAEEARRRSRKKLVDVSEVSEGIRQVDPYRLAKDLGITHEASATPPATTKKKAAKKKAPPKRSQ